MGREIVTVEKRERGLVLEAARALRGFEDDIARSWRARYERVRGQHDPRQAVRDFGATVELLLTSLADGDFDRYYDRIDEAGTSLARTREQYEDLILAFHMYEEATRPYLRRRFGDGIDDVLLALDHLYHNVIAILARAYFRELEREREQFINILAHDIRGPLSAISISGAMLMQREGEGEPNVREAAARISRNAERVVRLVDHLLGYGRLKSGKAVSAMTEIDLAACAREAAQLFLSDADRSKVEITLNGRRLEEAPCVPVPAHADRDLIVRAVGNFLTNAAKHARFAIAIGVRAEGDVAIVSVRDDGPGIATDQLPRIFDDYYVVPGGVRGTGLGLPSVRMIATAHGGRAWAESTEGSGSTFYLEVPRRLASPPSSPE